ncbi:hypothetical protein [Muribaculum gordoncarteri]|uniref:hypothetical protein n=1 Tax=Muribaculum gordoncarteri TaxID=2530390 RepID=UPI003F663CAB
MLLKITHPAARPAKYKKILVVAENAVRFLNEGARLIRAKGQGHVHASRRHTQHLRHGVTYAEGYRSGRAMYEREDRNSANQFGPLRNQAGVAKDADAVYI